MPQLWPLASGWFSYLWYHFSPAHSFFLKDSLLLSDLPHKVLENLVSLHLSSLIATILYHKSLPLIAEGNGKPLQYSCLGNTMDRGTLAG